MRDAMNMTASAMTHRTAWLRISANWSPNFPPAKNELDESTRLTPIAINDSVMTSTRRSVPSFSMRWPGVSSTGAVCRALCIRSPSRLEPVHARAKDLAALLVVLEHVEAGTRRRQQHRVAGLRGVVRDADGVVHVARVG